MITSLYLSLSLSECLSLTVSLLNPSRKSRFDVKAEVFYVNTLSYVQNILNKIK